MAGTEACPTGLGPVHRGGPAGPTWAAEKRRGEAGDEEKRRAGPGNGMGSHLSQACWSFAGFSRIPRPS
jgi:hypothetical protein